MCGSPWAVHSSAGPSERFELHSSRRQRSCHPGRSSAGHHQPRSTKLSCASFADGASPQTLEDRRHTTDTSQARADSDFIRLYPLEVKATSMAGVPVKVLLPANVRSNRRHLILINLHGGGFNSDSGSLTESVPVAYLISNRNYRGALSSCSRASLPCRSRRRSCGISRSAQDAQRGGCRYIRNISRSRSHGGSGLKVETTQPHCPEPSAFSPGSVTGAGAVTQKHSMHSGGLPGHLDVLTSRSSGQDEYAGATDLKDPLFPLSSATIMGLHPHCSSPAVATHYSVER